MHATLDEVLAVYRRKLQHYFLKMNAINKRYSLRTGEEFERTVSDMEKAEMVALNQDLQAMAGILGLTETEQKMYMYEQRVIASLLPATNTRLDIN